MTYYEAPHQFSQTEKDLAITIARQVGFSIERLQSERAREIAERDLSESEERFRLMSEQAPVMIWLSDANGKCLHLNRKLREFWSLTEKDIAASTFPRSFIRTMPRRCWAPCRTPWFAANAHHDGPVPARGRRLSRAADRGAAQSYRAAFCWG